MNPKFNFGAIARSMGFLDRKNSPNYFKFIILIMLFLLLSFDQDLAMIYIFILFGDWIWFKSDDFVSFKMSRSGEPSLITSLIETIFALAAFLGISTILVNTFSPQAIQGGVVGSAQSIFQLLATSTPILQGSAILTFVGWGILVPIIETSFFNGRLLEGFSTYLESELGMKVSTSKVSLNLIIVILIVASLFTLLHITAKGLDSIPLLITFIFSVISSILVLRNRQLKEAILLHIFTNGAAVSVALGWF